MGERAALSQVVQPGVCRPLRRERGAARPHHMRPRLADSAGRRSAANREHWCAALGAVALPAGTTVGQGHLLRVGDGDLFAADASAMWVGLRCLWVPCARFNHGQAAYSRPIGFPAGAANQPRRACGRSIRWRGLSVHWVCCEGLSGSCDETVTGVKPPYRARSQSRISSLAAIARRIADDRALKAPGQPSCSVARVLAMPGGFPRPRFTMRVSTMMIAPIRVMTNGCVAGSRRAKRAIVSADRRGSSRTPRLRSTGRAAGRGRRWTWSR